MNRKKSVWLVVLLVLAASIFASTITIIAFSSQQKENSKSDTLFQEPIPVKFSAQSRPSLSANAPTDFVYASEKSIHAVVHVKTVTYVQNRYITTDPFEFFFGSPFRSEPRQQIGMGSGVIISEDGYIVTNNHVIEGATDIEVTLNDKQKLMATVVGTDPTTDIALIKVDAANLPFLHFGDSDELKVGEWVLAVGNPFNLTSTVTAGIVSAKGRDLGILSERSALGLESFIQTDAAVNAGNSGGALVNMRGELVGINTAIASPTGNFSGYSFAVPSSIAQKVVEDLVQYGNVQRGILIGVALDELNAETAKKHKVSVDNYWGVLVVEVEEGSAAAEAGLKAGDVINRINGVDISNLSMAKEQIGRFRPGDKLTFKIVREGKEKALDIMLTNKAGGLNAIPSGDDLLKSLGGKFKPLSAADRSKLGINYGLQIIEVGKGKLQDSGIKKSYIILRVNKTPIDSEETLKSVLENIDGGALIEGVYPNGRVVYYGLGL
ncbi:MAG: Do family serine endopeptidase [Bacteroidales bacterium]|jgi:Do/DeqQ family serine protease|nr:Do family serine endopeptidase [Bacteroidales bacterium]